MHYKHTLIYMQLSACLSLFLNTDCMVSHVATDPLPPNKIDHCKLIMKHVECNGVTSGGNCGTIVRMYRKVQSG